MTTMRRTLLVGAALLSLVGGSALITASAGADRSAAGGGAEAAVSVAPSSGYPATTFTVGFRAPDRTGADHGQFSYYAVSVSGPGGAADCLSQSGQDAGAARPHARVRVRLRPGAQGWCLGAFQGTVTEQARPICRHGGPCPQYIVVLKTVGHFTFEVTAAPPGGDTTPPVFAGLVSAETCTPGPVRPGEQTPYHLAWKAAHDNVTPRSQIVYDIFMSMTSGGEDFSKPNWTSKPGATTFTTPDLPSVKPLYFVVRARDQAGRQDHNTVQRMAGAVCIGPPT